MWEMSHFLNPSAVKLKLNHVNHIVYTLNSVMKTMEHAVMGYEDR